MNLPIQQYFRSGGTVEDLERRYAVKAKRHPLYPELLMLKYSMVDSPMAEPIVQNCRGIILNEKDDWHVVCHSFNKFFNHGEGHAAPIDWSTARVEEKCDGSLMQLYNHDGNWIVASSGTPDAGGHVMCNMMTDERMTFQQLFWATWMELVPDKLHALKNLSKNCTYAFELMTPLNKVVVPHKEKKLALLGVRHRITGLEEDPTPWAQTIGVSRPRSYPLQSWDQCVEAARNIDPMDSEGYVVVDGNWNRVKMKAPAYVALAHIRDSSVSSTKSIVEVVRNGESTEWLAYFPEWTATFDDVRRRYNALADSAEDYYEQIKRIPIQKDFALEAQKFRWPAVLYQLRKGSVKTAREFFQGVNIKHLMEALKVEEKDLSEAA